MPKNNPEVLTALKAVWADYNETTNKLLQQFLASLQEPEVKEPPPAQFPEVVYEEETTEPAPPVLEISPNPPLVAQKPKRSGDRLRFPATGQSFFVMRAPEKERAYGHYVAGFTTYPRKCRRVRSLLLQHLKRPCTAPPIGLLVADVSEHLATRGVGTRASRAILWALTENGVLIQVEKPSHKGRAYWVYPGSRFDELQKNVPVVWPEQSYWASDNVREEFLRTFAPTFERVSLADTPPPHRQETYPSKDPKRVHVLTLDTPLGPAAEFLQNAR